MSIRRASDRPAGPAGFGRRTRPRWGMLALVAGLHVLALAGLARVFAPEFTASVVERAGSLITVTVTAPPDPPPPPPPPPPAPESAAASAAEGAPAPAATPREVTAPPAPLPRPQRAPPVAGTGEADRSGAADAGAGSGAGDAGQGAGAGGTGAGSGGGARPLALISGTIDNARDYPTPPGGRQVRRGHDVVIELAVGPDGRVTDCRVTDPSPDPEADAITCRLARERFVFQPRLNQDGEPVSGRFRWRQRWY